MFLTNSSGFFTTPINNPLKNTSTPSLLSLSNPSDSNSFKNLFKSKFTLVDTLHKIERFFLNPISVPSGVSIGQNLP